MSRPYPWKIGRSPWIRVSSTWYAPQQLQLQLDSRFLSSHPNRLRAENEHISLRGQHGAKSCMECHILTALLVGFFQLYLSLIKVDVCWLDEWSGVDISNRWKLDARWTNASERNHCSIRARTGKFNSSFCALGSIRFDAGNETCDPFDCNFQSCNWLHIVCFPLTIYSQTETCTDSYFSTRFVFLFLLRW